MTIIDREYIKKHSQKEPLALGLVDQIVVRYKEGVDESIKKRINQTFDLEKCGEGEIYEMYKVSKDKDILDLANRLFETGYYLFAYPQIIFRVTFCDDYAVYPNDPYFQYQVTLHNTGQTFNGHTGSVDADIDAPEAWAYTMGSEDIVIAVIDQGVSYNHPDLPGSRQVRIAGSNFGAGDPDDPSPTGNNNHGNACAGVIAATANNGEGIAGIAPLCKIMPIRFDETTSAERLADAICFATRNGANIISNSWSCSSAADVNASIVSAINYAINHNSLVLFAAGNTADHTFLNDNGYVTYPANQNIDGMLTVGASDRYDKQSNYSPSSSLIDVVAPSHKAYPNQIIGETFEMWSIDIPGNSGYNPWPYDPFNYVTTGEILPSSGTNNLSYTGRFGGTSHSCPVVAGVAALVLSVNPDLSPHTVCDIIKCSADTVGGYNYVNGRCDEMGYGRVNAHKAVWMACDTTFYVNQYSNSDENVIGCDIYMEDDYVYGSDSLTVRARNNVLIRRDLYIENGSKLDIKRYNPINP